MFRYFLTNSSSNGKKDDTQSCNLFETKAPEFTTITAETNDSAALTVPISTTNGSINARGVPILDFDEDGAGGSIQDLVMSLGHAQETSNTNTAVGSSLTTAATGDGLFTHRSISGVLSLFSSDNDDDDDEHYDDDTGDGNDADNECDEEPTPSTSGNYLDQWTPEYSSSLSIFATLSSGNFLSENEITQIFSRYGSVDKVKWTQIGDNNGYIIVFTSEVEKENAIKICGTKMETKGRMLKLWSFKRAHLLLNNKLGVIDATNCSSHKSVNKKDDNDPFIGDERLFGLANTFETNNSNDINNHQTCYRSQNTSTMTLNENMPSPERPGTRPSPATAFLLKQISEANMPETGQFCERISRDNITEKNRFLNLPAPYHLLPDTPYFRRAPIVPPPTRSLSATEQMPVQQRIINRYLASMKMDDENGFAAIAHYERQCYERLFASSHYSSATLMEQQQQHGGEGGSGTLSRGGGVGGGGTGTVFGTTEGTGMTIGKHSLGTDFFGPTRNEDQTRICTNPENNSNNNCAALLVPPGQQYEIWNCTGTWTWNYFNFKE